MREVFIRKLRIQPVNVTKPGKGLRGTIVHLAEAMLAECQSEIVTAIVIRKSEIVNLQ